MTSVRFWSYSLDSTEKRIPVIRIVWFWGENTGVHWNWWRSIKVYIGVSPQSRSCILKPSPHPSHSKPGIVPLSKHKLEVKKELSRRTETGQRIREARNQGGGLRTLVISVGPNLLLWLNLFTYFVEWIPSRVSLVSGLRSGVTLKQEETDKSDPRSKRSCKDYNPEENHYSPSIRPSRLFRSLRT